MLLILLIVEVMAGLLLTGLALFFAWHYATWAFWTVVGLMCLVGIINHERARILARMKIEFITATLENLKRRLP